MPFGFGKKKNKKQVGDSFETSSNSSDRDPSPPPNRAFEFETSPQEYEILMRKHTQLSRQCAGILDALAKLEELNHVERVATYALQFLLEYDLLTEELTEGLINAGADITAYCTLPQSNFIGMPATHIAILKGKTDLLAKMIEVTCEKIDRDSQAITSTSDPATTTTAESHQDTNKKKSAVVNATDVNGRTLLDRAAKANATGIIELLTSETDIELLCFLSDDDCKTYEELLPQSVRDARRPENAEFTQYQDVVNYTSLREVDEALASRIEEQQGINDALKKQCDKQTEALFDKANEFPYLLYDRITNIIHLLIIEGLITPELINELNTRQCFCHTIGPDNNTDNINKLCAIPLGMGYSTLNLAVRHLCTPDVFTALHAAGGKNIFAGMDVKTYATSQGDIMVEFTAIMRAGRDRHRLSPEDEDKREQLADIIEHLKSLYPRDKEATTHRIEQLKEKLSTLKPDNDDDAYAIEQITGILDICEHLYADTTTATTKAGVFGTQRGSLSLSSYSDDNDEGAERVDGVVLTGDDNDGSKVASLGLSRNGSP